MTDLAPALASLVATLAAPFSDPASRTWVPSLVIFAVIALVASRRLAGEGVGRWLARALGLHLWSHPSARADLWLLLARRLLATLSWLPELGLAWWIATHLARALDGRFGNPGLEADPWLVTVGYSLVLFVAWDLSRYVLHRLAHEIPFLWEFHQVHHSAEVLTPISFHRIHPVESALATLRGALVGGVLAGLAWWLFRGAAQPGALLGVHGIGLVLNAIFGNLRHSHVWIGFGPLERWFLSPAQHQLHHSDVLEEAHANYGTWLAIWDRMGGSWISSGPTPPRFGLPESALNHDPTDLWSMLVHPVVAAARRVAPVLVALLVAASAGAQETPDDEVETQYEIVVEAEDGIPRVAGSAHQIGEEQLDRFEYDDIHKVLDGVPGVYLRGEDGYGLRPNIGMRGGNADRSARIALMEDGVPLAPAPYAAPAAYYFPMATRLVGVEVFKGPASIRHGPQTVGGALNLQTRGVPRDGPDGAVDVSLGQRKTASGHAWLGTGTKQLGVLLEGAHLSSNGFKTLDTGGPTSFDRQDLMLKTRLATPRTETSHHAVELKLGYGHERSWETYLGLHTDDFADDPYRRYAASDGDLMTWRRTQAELAWQARMGEHVELRTVAYHHRLDRQWFKLNGFAGGVDLHDLLQQPSPGGQAAVYLGVLKGEVDSTGPDQNLLRGTNDRHFDALGVQSTARITHGGGRVRNELELGLRLHADRVTRVHTEAPWAMVGGAMERVSRDQTTLDSRTAADALAAHAHDTLDLGRFEWVPGVRVEVIRTAAGTRRTGAVDPQTRAIVLPGTGFLVQAGDDVDFFGGVHRGFSPVPPGAAEDQKPETAWSYELGLRAAPGETHLEAVGFVSDYTRLTGQCTFSSGCDESQLDRQFDGGAATIFGLEALAAQTVRLPGRLTLTPEATYTLTDGRFRTDFVSDFPQFGSVQAGDRLPYVPAHQGSAQVALDHRRFAVALSAKGRTALRDEASQGEVPESAAIPGVLTVDAATSVSLTERVELYGTGTNLANAAPVESWRPFGARPVAPRQLTIGVKGAL